MEVIDKYKFILTLSNETELSVDEATELINKIPFKYLEMENIVSRRSVLKCVIA